jgi:hypothetical protein
MRIVAIEHIRCSEHDKMTFLVVPEGMSEDDVLKAVGEAQDEYLKAVDAFKKMQEPLGYPVTNVLQIADESLTVGEVKKRHAEHEAERKAYSAARFRQTAAFHDYLYKRGFLSIYESHADRIYAVADWGHRHGDHLDY